MFWKSLETCYSMKFMQESWVRVIKNHFSTLTDNIWGYGVVWRKSCHSYDGLFRSMMSLYIPHTLMLWCIYILFCELLVVSEMGNCGLAPCMAARQPPRGQEWIFVGSRTKVHIHISKMQFLMCDLKLSHAIFSFCHLTPKYKIGMDVPWIIRYLKAIKHQNLQIIDEFMKKWNLDRDL